MTERLLTKIDTLKQRLGAGTAAIPACWKRLYT